MLLSPGARVGPYEIVSVLGAGGMGEVYRARDAKLRRDVAIKVLPAAFAREPERLARFRREAQVLATLNHPHIASIYGVEEADGVDALVLELVEGQTLAERIEGLRAKGPGLPLDEALKIAAQIADALDAAHEKGIVHRDFKPANVKVTPDDQVKVLDFGLAKALTDDIGADNTMSPTMTAMASRLGVIVGTAAYMSPEQAKGKPVDKRTDIWAFGCVLYEMLTGRRAFAGDDVTDLIVSVMTKEPEWTALPPATPRRIVELLHHCLKKDPRERLRDIGDARIDLKDVAAGTAPADEPGAALGPVARSSWRIGSAIGAVAASAAIAAVFVAVRMQPAPVAARSVPQLKQVTADDGFTVDPALSADGTLLAYASDRGGNLDIWVQQTGGGTPVQVTRDPIDEREPAFTPDGTQILFRSERNGGGLYVTPTFGSGAPRFLAESGRRPRVSPDGKMVAYWTGPYIGFSAATSSYRTFVVPLAGGESREITGFTGVRFPIWSPDGRSLLVLASRAAVPLFNTYDWWIVPLDGRAPSQTGAYARFRAAGVALETSDDYAAPEDWTNGDTLFSDLRHLWTAPVDAASRRVGAPIALTFGTGADAHAARSRAGLVAFTSAALSQNIWRLPLDVNRGVATGPAARLTTGRGFDSRASLSSGGQSVAYHTLIPTPAIVVRNLVTGGVVNVGVAGTGFGPALSPDGSTVAYGTDDNTVDVVAVHGGAPKTLCVNCQVGDWANDSRGLTVGIGLSHERRLTLIDIARGSQRDLTVQSARSANRPELSLDNRILAFRASASAGGGEAVWIARVQPDRPASESEWVPVTMPELDVRPCGWSPDGRVLYLVSSRDGNRCLYAQRIDPAACRPVGEAFIVQHFHSVHNIRAGSAGVLSTGPANAVGGGGFVYDLPLATSNIWTMTPATPAS